MKPCLMCGAATNPERPLAKFCSRRCKDRSYRLRPIGKVIGLTVGDQTVWLR